MTDSELREILEEHQKWLRNEGGKRADLSGANLGGANLREVNLSEVDLSGADLNGADLRYADLTKADLRDAILSGSNLRDANLTGANLSGACLIGASLCCADLRGANFNEADLRCANFQDADLRNASLNKTQLYEANFRGAVLLGADLSCTSPHRACLYGADLRETKNAPFIPMACPDTGSFIAWKKASGHIIKLLIPEDAKRSSATTRKCRANKAVVLAIENMDGSSSEKIEVKSNYKPSFIYRVGETVEVKDFDEYRFNECAPGIHFFINRDDAVFYH